MNRFAPRLLPLLAVALSSPARAAEPPAPLAVYTDATVIDGTGAAPRPHRDLLVRGERIVAIAEHGAALPAEFAKAQRIDLAGRFVIPGLIDSHVHLATPPRPAAARALLRRDLYGGVTAVRDMADDLRLVAELAREARQDEIAAPDIGFAALMAGPAFFADPRVAVVSRGYAPGTAPWMQAIDARTDLDRAMLLARGTGAMAIKLYADLPADRVAAITRAAHRHQLAVWAHSAVFPARPAEVIAAGVDSVSHACYLAYQVEPVMLAAYEDHTPVHEGLLRLPDDPVLAGLFAAMARRGMVLDATGSLFVRHQALAASHPGTRPLRCTGTATTALVRQAWRAGVEIAAGTDFTHGAGEAWPEVFDEVEFLVRAVGMPPLAALRAASAGGARALGLAAEMGTLEPGKLANFAVLAGDPTGDIGQLRSVVLTVRRGHAFSRGDYAPPSREELGDDHE